MATPAGSSNAQQQQKPSAEASAYQQLLRGSGRGEMGLDALAARARDLQKSLDQMATGLAVNAHNISWHDALQRFSVLQVQWQQLAAQLRPLAKHYVAHPKVVDAESARVLPIILATKLLPEMEAADAAALAAQRSAAGGASTEAQYGALLKATERFNAGLDRLTAAGREGQSPGLLDAGGSLRREIAAAGRSAGPVVGGAAALRRSAAETALPRKRKTPEAEALLAAVTTGQGLR